LLSLSAHNLLLLIIFQAIIQTLMMSVPHTAAILQDEGSMNSVRSIWAYLVLCISTIALGTAAILTAMITRRSELAHLVARIWGNVNLWAAGVKIEVHGLEHIDPSSSYVYAANHQSAFDILTLLGKLPVQFRWLAKTELFSIFVLGPAMRAAGYIPIDRSNRRKAFESMNIAAQRIKEGTSIVIFPEGTRSPDGVLQDFKKGGFILALNSQHPIVPISISGSYRIFPKRGGWKVHPGRVQLTISAPIPTEGLTNRERDELIRRVREAIRTHLTIREGGLLPDPVARDPSS
jgi:1-acyl-sn-glycerol-3-phosphate acyltransferase